jgi:hypothetical protein
LQLFNALRISSACSLSLLRTGRYSSVKEYSADQVASVHHLGEIHPDYPDRLLPICSARDNRVYRSLRTARLAATRPVHGDDVRA